MMTRRYALRDDQRERIKDLLPGRKGTVGVDGRETIDCLSKRCCTVTEQAFPGGTYSNDLEVSEWFTLASVDGQSPVCGNGCLSS